MSRAQQQGYLTIPIKERYKERDKILEKYFLQSTLEKEFSVGHTDKHHIFIPASIPSRTLRLSISFILQVRVHLHPNVDIMMPLSPDALYWRIKLFELCDPITMSPEKSDEIWPLVVDSVYCSKTVARYGFESMSVDFETAQNQAQHNLIHKHLRFR